MFQCQYSFLHQCVRDVLRARKHRSEQENPLYPIYENFNPKYCHGEPAHFLSLRLSLPVFYWCNIYYDFNAQM